MFYHLIATKEHSFFQEENNNVTYEDLNSHLLTLTQLAEESTALTVCPFGQKVRRGGDYLLHSLTIAIHLSWHMNNVTV